MADQLYELLHLSPCELIEVLETMITKMKTFRQKLKRMITERTGCLTAYDHQNIPNYLIKANQFVNVISVMRNATTLKYVELSDAQILVVDDILSAISVQQAFIEGLIRWFENQIVLHEFEK